MDEHSEARFSWPVVLASVAISSCLSGLIGVLLGVIIFGRMIWGNLSETTFVPQIMPSPFPDVNNFPAPTFAPIPTLPATPFVNEYPAFTIYWKRELWEATIDDGTDVLVEDFELDTSDYGELSYPYLTGNGFYLLGQEGTTAQIFTDDNLLQTGNVIHFRAWGPGLAFLFPNETAVRSFSFDYRPTETWQLTVANTVITIPKGRRGFIGIVFQADYPKQFILSSTEHAQGGLTMDNIAFIPNDKP